MKKIAIVISSHYGQTAKISQQISGMLQSLGHEVHLLNLRKYRDLIEVSIEGFDFVVVGGPVYDGRLPWLLIEWARMNFNELRRVPTAFFTVSLNAADERLRARAEDIRVIEDFLYQTGLRTDITAILIGALSYTKYGFIRRWKVRREWAEAGLPTDVSRNYELTDWDMVAKFATDVDRNVSRTLHV